MSAVSTHFDANSIRFLYVHGGFGKKSRGNSFAKLGGIFGECCIAFVRSLMKELVLFNSSWARNIAHLYICNLSGDSASIKQVLHTWLFDSDVLVLLRWVMML